MTRDLTVKVVAEFTKKNSAHDSDDSICIV